MTETLTMPAEQASGPTGQQAGSSPPRRPTERELARMDAWLERAIRPHKLDAVVPKLTRGQALGIVWASGGDALLARIEERRKLIEVMAHDPLRHGYKLDCWADADRLLAAHDELLIEGGNRASKTEYAARKVCEIICDPKKESLNAWCLHSTLPSSIEMQQPVIRKYLPPEWRDIGKKGKTTNVSWTDKNGFSEQVFVLPNGSRCRFLNYSMDRQVIEGGELDIIWCDELVPYDWVETLRYRLATRKGKLLITFTPVNGFSLVVKDYVAGATVSEWRPASLLPHSSNVTVDGRPGPAGMMPYVRTCAKSERSVIYFFGEMNPLGGFDQIKKTLTGLPKTQIMIRAYGYTERMETAVFPKFGEVHIVSPDKIPTTGTNYCVADPAGVKNWFIKWYRVVRVADDIEHVYLYREWPDKKRHGEWALPSEKAEGKAGPAQKSEAGRGIREYKKLILELEGWRWEEETTTWTESAAGVRGREGERENGRSDAGPISLSPFHPLAPAPPRAEIIERRIIDPRYGGAEVVTAEEGTSLIQMMADEQRDRSGALLGPAMYWEPAGIIRNNQAQLETSVQMIIDAMDYDAGAPLSIVNCPRWYVSSECEQSIYAYREFTGCGSKEHLKDVIDPDNYFIKSDCHYVDPKAAVSWGGGAY